MSSGGTVGPQALSLLPGWWCEWFCLLLLHPPNFSLRYQSNGAFCHVLVFPNHELNTRFTSRKPQAICYINRELTNTAPEDLFPYLNWQKTKTKKAVLSPSLLILQKVMGWVLFILKMASEEQKERGFRKTIKKEAFLLLKLVQRLASPQLFP